MDPGFPRLIRTDWPGIPRRVNAAFKLHGKTEIEVVISLFHRVEVGGLPHWKHFYTKKQFWNNVLLKQKFFRF